MKHFIKIVVVLTVWGVIGNFDAFAQNKKWTLEETIAYAEQHNLSIQLNELNERLSKLNYQQSVLSQIPNINSNLGYGVSSGRSVDPTTNQFTQSSYNFASGALTSDVLLFGWFQKRNQIAANNLNWQATKLDNEQLQNDIRLNIANGFLRSVLAFQQILVNEKQVELSKAQLNQTTKLSNAGSVPELNVAQLESQLANDSSNLITAISNYNASILDMKALLNLPFETYYEPYVPELNLSEQIQIANQTPESIYETSRRNYFAIQSNDLRIKAAEKLVKASQGALLPSLGFGAQLGTNYASSFKQIKKATITGSQPNGSYIDAGGTLIPVYEPTFGIEYENIPFLKQFENNFRQTYSLSLAIPIFNGWQSQAAVRRSKIDLIKSKLQYSQVELDLKTNIYKAHNEVANALQKYKSAQKAAYAAQRAFEYAKKRYDIGLTNTVEYLVTQQQQYQAETQLQSSLYDLIFKMKVIDYYLGKPLKL